MVSHIRPAKLLILVNHSFHYDIIKMKTVLIDRESLFTSVWLHMRKWIFEKLEMLSIVSY